MKDQIPHSPYVFLQDITTNKLFYQTESNNEILANAGNDINSIYIPENVKTPIK